MPKSTTIITAIVGTVGIVGMAALAGPPKKDPKVQFKPFKPIQTVERLMESQGELYNGIKDHIIDKSWDEAETSAWLLAELANVNHFQSTETQYQKFADDMASDCVALAKILKRRDVREARSSVKRVQQRCKACHDVYKKDDG